MTISSTHYLIGECSLLGATLIFTVARFGVRVWRRSWTFWVSDICLVVPVLCQSALFFGDLVNFSRGRTEFSVIYDYPYGKWLYGAWVIFDAQFYFPRFSLLAFYYELFPISERNMRICLYVVMAYTAAGFITNLCVNLLWCGPDLSQNWRTDVTCALFLTLEPLYINWSIGISTELCIFALPMPLLWKMKKLHGREKLALVFVLFLGVVTIAVSTTRFTLMALLNYGKETYLMGSAEISTQIIIVTVPALRPLLGVVKVPATVRSWGKETFRSWGKDSFRSWGTKSGGSRSGTGRSGASTAGVCTYEPGSACPVVDYSGSMHLPDFEVSRSESIQLPDIEVGGSLWQEVGRPQDNDTSRSPEPWEAITLPRLIE